MRKKFKPSNISIAGVFLNSRFFSGCSARGLAYVVLLYMLLFSVISYNHTSLLNQAPSRKIKSKQKLADHSADMNRRDQQHKSFSAKIDSLRLQLVNLNQLAEKIKIALSLDHKSSDGENLGVGGSFTKDISGYLANPAKYNQWIKHLDAEMNRLDYSQIDHFDEYQVLLETVKEIKTIQDATPGICPVEGGRISSNFGYRQSPFKGSKEFHSGLDISAHKGTPVKATANGFVAYAGYDGDLGKTVIIDHGFGLVTQYGHLTEIKVKSAQQVKCGDLIGRVGSTGRSTGPHLHYEVRLKDNPVNPKKYIPEYLASKGLPK